MAELPGKELAQELMQQSREKSHQLSAFSGKRSHGFGLA